MTKLLKSKGEYVLKGLELSNVDSMTLECGDSIEVEVKKVDNRKISDQQRKFIFALCSEIGTKGNRNKISHIGLIALPLCRYHHTEIHNSNRDEFIEKYHLTPFVIDKKMEYFIKKGKIRTFNE